eukprot:GHVS01050216.1.p1 GENE.GHVS01050216.1~~GHVS01050216.1.p1  ORF type:complete len:1027 (-),score=170.20 GHVS01050216.1:2750-5830(-)
METTSPHVQSSPVLLTKMDNRPDSSSSSTPSTSFSSPPSSSSWPSSPKREPPPGPPWSSSRLVEQNKRVFHQILQKTGTHSGLFRYIKAMPCLWPDAAAGEGDSGAKRRRGMVDRPSTISMRSPDAKRRRKGDEEEEEEGSEKKEEVGIGEDTGGLVPSNDAVKNEVGDVRIPPKTQVSYEERYMAVVEALCQQLQDLCHSNKKLKQSSGDPFNNVPPCYSSTSSRKRKKATTSEGLFVSVAAKTLPSNHNSDVIDLDGDSTTIASCTSPTEPSTANSSCNGSPSRPISSNMAQDLAELVSVSCQTDAPPPPIASSSIMDTSLSFFALDLVFVHIFFHASSPTVMSCPCESTDTILRILSLHASAGEFEIDCRAQSLLQKLHNSLSQHQRSSHQEVYVPSELVSSWYSKYKGEENGCRQANGEVLLSAATKAVKRLVECGRELRSRVAFWASHVEQSLSSSCDLNELLMIPIGTQTREQVKEKYAAAMEALGGGDEETSGQQETTQPKPQSSSSFSCRLRLVRQALNSARKIWDDIEAEAAAKQAKQDSQREEARRKHEEQRSHKLNVQWNYVSYITKYRRIIAPSPITSAAPPPVLSYADAVDKWSGNADKLNDPSIQPFVILGLNPSLYRNVPQKEVTRQIGNGKKKLSLFVHPDKCSGSMGGSEELSNQASTVFSTMTTACEMCVTLIQTGGYLSKQKGSPSPFADLFGQTPSPMTFPDPSPAASAGPSKAATSKCSPKEESGDSAASLGKTSGPSSNCDVRPSGLHVEYIPSNKKESLRISGSLPTDWGSGHGEVRVYVLRPVVRSTAETKPFPPPSDYAPPDCLCYVARKEFRPRGKLTAAYLSDGDEQSDEEHDLKEYARRKALRKQYKAALNKSGEYDGAIDFRIRSSHLQPLHKSSKNSYNWYIDGTDVNLTALYWVGVQVVGCQVVKRPSEMVVSKIVWTPVAIPSADVNQTVSQTLKTFEGAPFVDQERLKPYIMAGSNDAPSKAAMKLEADCLRLAKAWARTTKYGPTYQAGLAK